MTYREHLQAIRDQHGYLTAELVADEAQPDDHPLHAFVYDKAPEEAARAYYVTRAATLLRVVKLPAEPGRPTHLRAFAAVRGPESHKADYVPTREALADPFTRQLVLRDMEREWKIFKRRYEHMAEFAELIRREQEGLTA